MRRRCQNRRSWMCRRCRSGLHRRSYQSCCRMRPPQGRGTREVVPALESDGRERMIDCYALRLSSGAPGQVVRANATPKRRHHLHGPGPMALRFNNRVGLMSFVTKSLARKIVRERLLSDISGQGHAPHPLADHRTQVDCGRCVLQNADVPDRMVFSPSQNLAGGIISFLISA